MKYGEYLIRSRHTTRWYVRVIIPAALRPQFSGRREIRRSTGTNDKAEARKFARAFRAWCDQLFRRAEDMSKKHGKNGKSDEASLGLITVTYADGTDFMADFGARDDAPALEIQAVTAFAKTRAEEMPVGRVVESSNVRQRAETRMKFSELVERFKKKRRGMIVEKKITQRSYDEEQSKVDLWAFHFGEIDVDRITRKDIVELQDWLPYIPSGYFKQKTPHKDAIAAAKELAAEGADNEAEENEASNPIASRTYNKYVGALSGILSYADELGAHTEDLSKRLKSKDGANSRRLPFDQADLKILFPGSEYGVDFGHESSGVSFEAKFWMPLLGAFTGARVEELAQLTCQSLQIDEATAVLHLRITDKDKTADGKSQKIKNSNSVRPIPIHPVLERIGFSRYVKQRAATYGMNANLLNLPRSPSGKYGGQFSKWFSRKSDSQGYVERRGIQSSGEMPEGSETSWWTKSYHSFRHSVADNLKAKIGIGGAGIGLEDIALAIGHVGQVSDGEQQRLDRLRALTTVDYGSKDQVSEYLELRQKVINAIDYKGVSFDGIKWR
jgi:integrase